jgi:hypothetical protein
MNATRVALLGFLPWTDDARAIAVRENPAALAAARAAATLARSPQVTDARAHAIEVSAAGVDGARAFLADFAPRATVALGQTRDALRVERQGVVPGAWTRRVASEGPFPLLIDGGDAEDDAGLAEALAARLAPLVDPQLTPPLVVSDDPGGYYCDHLCVELSLDARARGARAAFLHVPAIDGCEPALREARLALYARLAVATAEWLLGR